MSEQVKIGDMLYAQLGYRDKDPFQPREIIGETKFSWLVRIWEGRTDAHKVNKKTMLEAAGRNSFNARRWYTKKGVEDFAWIQAHRWKIAGMVQVERDGDKLRQIAAIVGYKEAE